MKNNISIYKKAMVAVAAMLSITACDKDVFDFNNDPFKGQTYKTTLMEPISSVLTQRADFSEYVSLLNYSGMFNALNQSSDGTSFTAFVPTNDAMQQFYRRRGVSSMEELGPDYARAFMLYHTVKDSILPDAFVQKKMVYNLSNDEIKIEIDPVNAGQITLNGEGRIVEMGLSAFNGKIYVLSSAMTPLVETVFDRVVESSESTIMAEAIRQSGWSKRLNTIVDTTYNQERQRVITHYYYTLLNVTDATFAKSGISSFSDLMAQLKANDKESLTEDSLLREYVGYHILANAYTTDDMSVMSGSETVRLWNTSAKNQVFTVTFDEQAVEQADMYVINKSSRPARFVYDESNLLCKNGYIHQLDDWMPVWEPDQATIVWDLADYTDIKNIVDPENYQPAEPTSKENIYRIATAPCFTFEQGEAGTKNRTYHEIDYVTCKSNLPAVNNDRVVYNLGYMGSVSMKTPVIVKGKYRVELSFIYMTNQNFMRTMSDGNGGMLKMSFDDDSQYTIFTSPYTKVPKILPGIYSTTLYEEIEFPETASHDFSFVVLDPAASTNSNFSLQFDTITFIPIE
ncbi:MAG: DUF5108 domain-containing protein [Prevotella sp.]|nr:DUF5108 domain-containing protein [Prevotella sp.]